MATVDDETFHPYSDDPYWNESAYLSFNVPERGINGFVYFYHRMTMRYTVGGIAVWDACGADIYDCLHYDFGTPFPIEASADMYRFRLPNSLRVECVKPLEKYRFEYKGGGAELELTWSAIMEPHSRALTATANTDQFGGDHFNQGGQATGILVLDGERIPVSSGSFRDHSWGPRRLSIADRRGSFSVGVGTAENSFCLWHVATADPAEDPIAGAVEKTSLGWYIRDGVRADVVSGTRRVLDRSDDGRPTRIELNAVDALNRELLAEGDCYNWIKFPGYPEYFTSFIGTRWRLDGTEIVGEEQEWMPAPLGRHMLRRSQ
jgi:hypothetical protein